MGSSSHSKKPKSDEFAWSQVAAFIDGLKRSKFTSVHLSRLLKDPDLLYWWVRQLRGHEDFTLIHEVYTPIQDIYALAQAHCLTHQVDFERLAWEGSAQPPEFDPKNDRMVVALAIRLGTLQQTFDFGWAGAAASQKNSWLQEEFSSDPEHLEILEGAQFRPWTKAWVRVMLDTNVNKRVSVFRTPDLSPGTDMLFVAAQHPRLVQAIDLENRFGMFLPGLRCSLKGDTGETEKDWVPCIYFSPDDGRIKLGLDREDDEETESCIPMYVLPPVPAQAM